MELTELAPRLERHNQNLETLISAFEGAELPDPDHARRLWEQADRDFDGLRAALDAAPELSPEVRRGVDRARKLSAVATSLLVRVQEAVQTELGTVRRARKELNGRSRPDLSSSLGGACDILG